MSDPNYNAVPPGGYADDEDEEDDEEDIEKLTHRRSIMNNFWSRLSAKTKERIICAVLYAVWMIVFWFFGPTEKMSKATAYFGQLALTGVFAVIYWFVKTKILRK